MADSHFTMCGQLTRDPELRFTAGGRGQAVFSVAVARRFQRDGAWQEETSFFNCVGWAQMAENFCASARKGDRVMLTGWIQQRSYETKEGEKRSVVEFQVEECGLSVKWARAEFERTERDSPQERRRQDPVYGDEEPF
jgi:single-strand DNA-binding protein